MAVLCDKFDGLLQMETFRLSHAEIAHDSAPLFPMRHAWLSRRASVKVVGWEKSANDINQPFVIVPREIPYYVL